MFVYYMFLIWIVGEFFCVLGQTNTWDPQIKQWKCANPTCSVPISQAEVSMPLLNPDHKLKLPLKGNDKVDVLRKPGDNEKEKNFWWISIDGKEGFAYKSYLREKKIISPKLINVEKEILAPTPTLQVVDGTTIYDGDFDQNIIDHPPNIYNPTVINTPQHNLNDNDTDVKLGEDDEDGSVEVETEEEEEEITADSMNNIANPITDGPLDSKSNVDSEMLQNYSANVPENVFSTVPPQVTNINNLEQSSVNPLTSSQISSETSDASLNKESSELKKDIDNKNTKEITSEKSSDTIAPPVENIQTSINQENIDETSQRVKEQTESEPNLSSPFITPPPLKEDKQGSTKDEVTNLFNNFGKSTSVSKSEITNEKVESISVPAVDNANNLHKYQPGPIKQDQEMIINHIPEPETVITSTVQPTKKSVPDEPNESVSPQKTEKEKLTPATEYPPQHNYYENPNNYFSPASLPTLSTLGQENVESTTEFVKYEEGVTDKIESITSEIKDKSDNEQITSDISPDSIQIQSDGPLDPGKLRSDILSDSGEVQSDSLPDPGIVTSSSSPDPGLVESNNLPNESIKEENLSNEPVTPDTEINNERVENTENLDNSYVDKIVSNLEDENNGDSSMNWFSSVYTLMDSLKELYTSSFGKEDVTEPENIQSVKLAESFNNPPPLECNSQNSESSNVNCQTTSESIIFPVEGDNILPQISLEESYVKMDSGDSGTWMSFKSMMGVGFSAVVVLVFSLGYYYIDNLRRDGELVLKNNTLASELFVVEREKTILEEDFTKVKEDLERITEEKNTFNAQSACLKDELNKIKEEKSIAEERESKLIKKLVMVEQNYNELRKIFSETKQKGERATLISDIKKLKDSIAADNIEIASLKEELQERKNEIKTLSTNLQKSQEAKAAVEERIDKLTTEGKDIAKDYQETLSKMEQTIEENKVVQSQLEEDVRKLKKECESLIIQKELAESALQKAHGITSKKSLAEWMEVRDVRSSLISAEKEISKLTKEGDELSVSLKSSEEKVKSLTAELENLNEKYESAEKEKIEALTKLQVLSNYFKEKETQLQEELGMKEAQWLQKQSDDSTIYQQMRDLREENLNLKALIETLKKEILDQEASYKKIVNTTEQKAHENWVSLRRAEVRLKEVQAEAAQLRNRLTTLETCDNPEEKLNKTTASGGLEVNGDLPQLGSAMSPPFMLYPNEFIPPPPLIQVPQNSSGNPSSRPAPLGRISSPPLVSGDFIPPPPIVPFELYPHIHPNPPSPPILHKPQPRDHHHMAMPPQVPSARKQKDSQSSNQSSESPLDNKTPARRSKR